MNTFARRVAKFRKDSDLTLRAAASKFGTTQTTVQRIERGGMPTIPVFRGIVKAMKYDPAKALADLAREK